MGDGNKHVHWHEFLHPIVLPGGRQAEKTLGPKCWLRCVSTPPEWWREGNACSVHLNECALIQDNLYVHLPI